MYRGFLLAFAFARYIIALSGALNTSQMPQKPQNRKSQKPQKPQEPKAKKIEAKSHKPRKQHVREQTTNKKTHKAKIDRPPYIDIKTQKADPQA